LVLHGFCATLRKRLIVPVRTDRIGMAGHHHLDEAVLLRGLHRFADNALRFRGQVRLVEVEEHDERLGWWGWRRGWRRRRGRCRRRWWRWRFAEIPAEPDDRGLLGDLEEMDRWGSQASKGGVRTVVMIDLFFAITVVDGDGEVIGQPEIGSRDRL